MEQRERKIKLKKGNNKWTKNARSAKKSSKWFLGENW